jgi:DNA-binding response OmpR family regulator
MPSLLLLVDDEALVRMTIEGALEDAGFDVRAAASGREAMSLLDAEIDSLAAVITDVNLGDVSGWEVARHARELRPAMPVVYVTGDSAADWAAQGVPKSVLVEKPFAPAQIVTAVASLLNRTDTVGPG